MRPSVALPELNTTSNTEERNVRPRIGCSLPPPFSWIELFDERTNKWYYYNKDTKVSQWEKPSDFPPSGIPSTYARSSNFSTQKQQPREESLVNQLRSRFEMDFPREYPSEPSKLLGAICMENNPKQHDMSWVSGTPPVNVTGSSSDLESTVHLKSTSDKLNAEQTPAHPDIICFDGNLPSPWWELHNEIAGIHYYWHSVLNVTQSERPSCLPPIQPCSTCGSNVQRGIEQTQQHQELQALTMTNNQQDKWVAVSPIPGLEPRFATRPDTNLGSKKSLYLSFRNNDGRKKWYYINLGGNINENGSRHELITNLLDETGQSIYRRDFTVLNSSIYMIADKSGGLPLPSFMLQVLETQSQERPAWKELTPLAKNHVQPWAVSMGGKIYVVGAENKGNNITPRYELNEIEVISDLESCKWGKLPVRSLKFDTPEQYFVLAFEDENKIVIGSGTDKCLYLYDVCTHELEMLGFSNYIGMQQQHLPPVLVGNRLFKYSYTAGIMAYDLVERGIWQGKIDGLDWSFFLVNCNRYERPVLIYLGGDKLCLFCLKSRIRKRKTSVVHLCIFCIPEFRVQGGKRSLHGHFHSVHKFYVEKVTDLMNVLLM